MASPPATGDDPTGRPGRPTGRRGAHDLLYKEYGAGKKIR
jgi:hypothetical protein